MITPAVRPTLLTVEEFVAREEASPRKHEFVRGDVYEVAAVTGRHNRIAINLVRLLSAAAQSSACHVFVSDVKLAAARDVIYYPDLMTVCGPVDLNTVIVRDPCLVIEIASPSTARYDKCEKLEVYQRIPSLKAYLVVEQAWRRVDRHFRDADGAWQREELTGNGTLPIPCPETTFTLDEIYESLAPLTVRELEAIGYSV